MKKCKGGIYLMKIMGLTREHVQTDASEAESPLALGKTQTAFSPGPTERDTHWELPAQLCDVVPFPFPVPAGCSG